LQNTGGKLATALKPNDNNTIDITNRYVMPIKEEALFCPTQIQHEKFAFFKKCETTHTQHTLEQSDFISKSSLSWSAGVPLKLLLL
jgi:hypothetical protein